MCSISDSSLENELMPAENLSSGIGSKCRKCNENLSEVVLRKKDGYCRICFKKYATHKFRAALGKSKIIRPEDKVLIAVTGSTSCSALLHLVREGVREEAHKRLRFLPLILYVDECATIEQKEEECRSLHQDVKQWLLHYDFPSYYSFIETILGQINEEKICIPLQESCTFISHGSMGSQLKYVLSQVNDVTSKEDLLLKLRTKLLLAAARELQCSKILVADTGTNLATKIISNVALGRGAHLPLDIGFCDSRDPEIKVLRPLRDFMNKEIAFYNVFNNVFYIPHQTFGSKLDPEASIQKASEQFITELECEFPSTVSTVFRTGDKLNLTHTSSSPEEECALCQAPLDISVSEVSALKATEFSYQISKSGKIEYEKLFHNDVPDQTRGDCCLTGAATSNCRSCCSSRKFSNGLSYEDMKDYLCYGCRLIIRNMASLEDLPEYILSHFERNMNFKQMKNQFKDFLL